MYEWVLVLWMWKEGETGVRTYTELKYFHELRFCQVAKSTVERNMKTNPSFIAAECVPGNGETI